MLFISLDTDSSLFCYPFIPCSQKAAFSLWVKPRRHAMPDSTHSPLRRSAPAAVGRRAAQPRPDQMRHSAAASLKLPPPKQPSAPLKKQRARWDSSAAFGISGPPAAAPHGSISGLPPRLAGSQSLGMIFSHRKRPKPPPPPVEEPILWVRYGKEPARPSEDKLLHAGRGTTRRPIPQSVLADVEKLSTSEFKTVRQKPRLSHSATAARLLRPTEGSGSAVVGLGAATAVVGKLGASAARAKWLQVRGKARPAL